MNFPHRLKRAAFVTVAVLGLWSPCLQAITFYGVMNCTIIETNDPLFSVGDGFQNWYAYESPTADGTFYSGYMNPDHLDPTGTGQELFGEIFTIRGDYYSHFYSYGNIADAFGAGGAFFNRITVAKGEVTDFYWDNQQGSGHILYSGTSFNMFTYEFPAAGGDEIRYFVKGTINFPNPTSSVPDGDVSIAIIGGTVFFLGLLRSKLIRKQKG